MLIILLTLLINNCLDYWMLISLSKILSIQNHIDFIVNNKHGKMEFLRNKLVHTDSRA